jgi:hypothetical protein
MSDIVYKKNAFSTPFLRGFKSLKIPIVDTDGIPAWPEMFPLEKVETLRNTVGLRHFASQMMLNTVPPERIRLDPGAMHFYDDEFNPHNAKIGNMPISGAVIYWDPSMGGQHSDGSVCVMIYRDDKSHRFFIHDVMYMTVAENDNYPMSHQCESVLKFMSHYNMRRICVETNGIGNTLPEIMRDCAVHNGYDIYVQRVTNSKRKSDRIIDTIEPILSTGRLYCASRVRNTPLLSEMMGWSPAGYGIHDDGIDAVAGAIAATPVPISPIGRVRHVYSANTQFKIS